jgi:hypothetical protein
MVFPFPRNPLRVPKARLMLSVVVWAASRYGDAWQQWIRVLELIPQHGYASIISPGFSDVDRTGIRGFLTANKDLPSVRDLSANAARREHI